MVPLSYTKYLPFKKTKLSKTKQNNSGTIRGSKKLRRLHVVETYRLRLGKPAQVATSLKWHARLLEPVFILNVRELIRTFPFPSS